MSEEQEKETKETKKNNTFFGLPENIEGALCYLLWWVSGIIFYSLETKSDFVKFHAKQSIVTFLIATVLVIIISPISGFIGNVLNGILWVVIILIWLYLMLKAFANEKVKLPWIGNLVDKK